VLKDDEITAVFQQIDDNGDGVLTRDEFMQGYALLADDSCARAAAEREKVARAVEQERVRATKEAASKLAEAQLMDVLFSGPSPSNRRRAPPPPRNDQRRRAKTPAGRNSGPRRVGGGAPYARFGPVPEGFAVERAAALVEERVAAKAARDYGKADALQRRLAAMGVRLDDRWRTWSVELTLALAKDAHEAYEREAAARRAKRPRAWMAAKQKRMSVTRRGAAAGAVAGATEAAAGKGDAAQMSGVVTSTSGALPLHFPTEDPDGSQTRKVSEELLSTVKGMEAAPTTSDSMDEGGGE